MSRPRKPRVLCLDDEPHVLEALRDTLRRQFEIVVSTNGFEALRLLAAEEFEVVIADMRMPMLDGARFLVLAREHAPGTVRMMLTGHAELADAASAINDGEIFRLLIKPCKTDDLTAALDAGVVRYGEQRTEREALGQTVRAATAALIGLATGVDPDAPARAAQIRKHAVELAGRVEHLDITKELEQACELMQIGAAVVSPETRARAGGGMRLSPEHAAELERLPELAIPLLPDLPGLGTVAALLSATAWPSNRAASPSIKTGAAVLRIALDFELQIRQGAPMETGIRYLGARPGRYDPDLLRAFSSLMQFT